MNEIFCKLKSKIKIASLTTMLAIGGLYPLTAVEGIMMRNILEKAIIVTYRD